MENATTEKKGFLQNDRLLVCSLLAFYGLCLIGIIAVTFRWLNDRNQILSANATATAVARTTELAQYEFIDTFASNINRWRTGPEENDYWNGSIQVESGFYIWDI